MRPRLKCFLGCLDKQDDLAHYGECVMLREVFDHVSPPACNERLFGGNSEAALCRAARGFQLYCQPKFCSNGSATLAKAKDILSALEAESIRLLACVGLL